MSYVHYPVMGQGVIQVASFASLPASAANGQLFETLDTNNMYAYNSTSMTFILVGGSSSISAVGAIDTPAASADGAHIAGGALIMQSASVTVPGLVNNTTQSFSGNKTFTGTVAASNISGANTGDVTLTAIGAAPNANAASLAGQVLTLQPADASNPGVVSVGTQSFSGNKTFGGSISASNFSGNVTGTNTGDVSLDVVGSTPNANAASLSGQELKLQPASASFPGVVTTGAQTFAGAKTFSSPLNVDGGMQLSASGTLALGTGVNTSVLNIGNAGATININGTVLYENVTQLQVTDPLITLNKGGGTGSASNSGIELEENAVITGYIETSGDRNSWTFKAPNTAGIVTMTPGAAGFTISESSHNPVTLAAVGGSPNANAASLSGQVLNLQPADATNPGVVTTGTQSFAGAKTFTGAISASNLSGTNTNDVTLTAAGSSPNANAASLSGQALTLQPADATNPGILSAGVQTIGGAKTFSSTLSASNLSGTNTGDVTLTAFGSTPNANGASLSGQILTLQPANASFPGSLSAADWTTFNNKLTLPALTAGSVLFSNGTTIAQDNANFFWDDSTNRLGIGTNAPSDTLSVVNPNSGQAVFSIKSTSVGGYSSLNIMDDAGSVVGGLGYGNASTSAPYQSSTYLASSNSRPLVFITNGIERMRIANGGTINIWGFTTDGMLANDASGTISSVATVPVAKGGTNSSTTLSNNRIMQSSGGAIVEAAAVTANRALISDANGIPVASVTTNAELAFVNGVTSAIQTQINAKFTLPALTSGSVLFSNGTTIAQDNANFFWDDTNNRLAVGNNAPSHAMVVGSDLGSLGFGDKALIVGNTSASSMVAIGQDGSHNLQSLWAFNATPSLAVANLVTYGYSNPLRLDASIVSLQSQSGGNVGIGTTAPDTTLHVVGQVKITGGSPGAGKVLTSDSVGLATWTSASTGTVTSVTAGTGLNVGAGPGGSVTTTGTLNLANTAVTPGSYTRASITVDQQGRLTAASSGAAINLAADVTGVLPLANGGSSKALTAVAGGIVWSDADSMEISAAGTTGQYLKSAGTGAPVWANRTPTVQRFTSGSGATYTTPAGVSYIRVTVIGGGGGGGGSGTAAGANGGDGGTSTFGSSLLTSVGGKGGAVRNAFAPQGSGGAPTISSPALAVYSATGGSGCGGGDELSSSGGDGGASMLGGNGNSGVGEGGQDGGANTGAGAGGGGTGATALSLTGQGGGAGASVVAFINAPSATYTYTVGAAGTAGTAGTNGFAGGAGAAGVIVVEEHY